MAKANVCQDFTTCEYGQESDKALALAYGLYTCTSMPYPKPKPLHDYTNLHLPYTCIPNLTLQQPLIPTLKTFNPHIP